MGRGHLALTGKTDPLLLPAKGGQALLKEKGGKKIEPQMTLIITDVTDRVRAVSISGISLNQPFSEVQVLKLADQSVCQHNQTVGVIICHI